MTRDDRDVMMAMDWVIPPDSSPGAGQPELLVELRRVVGDKSDFWSLLQSLRKEDLDNPHDAFAQHFVSLVRDIYYAQLDSEQLREIGFRL